MAVAQLTKGDGIIERKPRSLFSDSMDRLKKNKLALISIAFVILMCLMAIFAPLITSGDYAKQDLVSNNAVPEWMLFILPDAARGNETQPGYARINNDYVMGQDDLGRDIWTRTVYGARVSLMIAIVASTVSLGVGTLYGLVSGYMGGTVDSFMMRFVDFLYGFPFLIVVILLQTYFKAVARRGTEEGFASIILDMNSAMGGLLFLFIAIGLINWLGLARVTRGEVLSLREKEYVQAAKAIGSKDTRIIFRHILPNIVGTLIVVETLAIPGYIFTEAFLSFIGLGVDPPTPSWGIMISESAQTIRSYPNQVLVPALALTLTTLAFNFLGDGLRDAFDPKQKE
jgi:oligopeptide transport system permease protein